jgi:hypothetical protein
LIQHEKIPLNRSLPISSLIDVIANDDECDEFKVQHEIWDHHSEECYGGNKYFLRQDYLKDFTQDSE